MSDDDELRAEFRRVVNMAPAELERWLSTEESRSVGDKKDGGEAVGHEMGRHVVAILRTRVPDLSDSDLRRMRKVVGYVHRHTARRPSGDVRGTPWRYSLMNWGHDPLHTS